MVGVLVLSDIVQSTYQKRLMAAKVNEINDPNYEATEPAE